MASFEANLQNVQQRLGRRLSVQEIRLLQLWDSVIQAGSGNGQACAPPSSEIAGESHYQGRFKVAFMNGHYEVFFVCSSALFRGVAIDRKEDVLAFLTQPPIDLDPILVRQALAAAETLKPTQINFPVSVTDSMLRSMGFEQNQ